MLRLNQRVCDFIITLGAIALFTSWLVSTFKIQPLNEKIAAMERIPSRAELVMPSMLIIFSTTNIDAISASEAVKFVVVMVTMVNFVTKEVAGIAGEKIDANDYEYYRNEVLSPSDIEMQETLFRLVEELKTEVDKDDADILDKCVMTLKTSVSALGVLVKLHKHAKKSVNFYTNLSYILYALGSVLALLGAFVKIFVKKE